MLTPTTYSVDTNLLKEACIHLPETGMKNTINQPTGDFFYDPWAISDEYKGTIWETLYDSLPVSKGEARIITLDPGQCYQAHADIDDRYHLNVTGDKSYIIDLENNQMHFLKHDGVWYDMNAGLLHTATNFGQTNRVQLVVRKLLKRNNVEDPVTVTVTSNLGIQSRYMFDYHLSPWLNVATKNGYITDFEYSPEHVRFKIARSVIEVLKNYLPKGFNIE